MFSPKTEQLKTLVEKYPAGLEKLSPVLDKKTNVYIDYANVVGWQDRLGWKIHLKRLKNLLDSFDTVNSVKFYYGTLEGDERSEALIEDLTKWGYEVKTKPVKIMHLPMDVSSIDLASPTILQDFIKKPFLNKLKVEDIEYLNKRLQELNAGGTRFLEVRKCNFDVEIGVDMLLDHHRHGIEIENFVLWSGDSDFANPAEQLMKDNKRVVIFSRSGKVAPELAQTGAEIFDIRKIREYICRQSDLFESDLTK
jgi:uncharacterized LabA/DUF88 family protein